VATEHAATADHARIGELLSPVRRLRVDSTPVTGVQLFVIVYESPSSFPRHR